MAKGARSKVKKRMNTARRVHLYNIRDGKTLEKISKNLASHNYDLKEEYELAPNAFLHPKNPRASFP